MAIVKPSTILEPFAINGDLVVPPATSSAIAANQDTGFPLLQSTPIGAGGLPVQRDQMNGVINLYSQFCFWQQCGGQYTFDAAISTQYGGYPAGIVLYCALNNSFQLSKINNNTANFVATPSYINDGIHWQQVTYPTPTGQATYITSGAHTFTVPIGVGFIVATIIGAGGGGAAGHGSITTIIGGGGGGGGDFVYKKGYAVTAGETINITVGVGGNGGTGNGGAGGNGGGTTIAGTFGTVTLSGGNGGNPSGLLGVGGIGGGSNGIAGNSASTAPVPTNADTVLSAGAMGGGVPVGCGGSGGAANSSSPYHTGRQGLYGGGGGGGGAFGNSGATSFYYAGGNGGTGFVSIEFGIIMSGT